MRQNSVKAEREKRELDLERETERQLFREHEAQQRLLRDAIKGGIMVRVSMVPPIVLTIGLDAYVLLVVDKALVIGSLIIPRSVPSGQQALAFCFSPYFCLGAERKTRPRVSDHGKREAPGEGAPREAG